MIKVMAADYSCQRGSMSLLRKVWVRREPRVGPMGAHDEALSGSQWASESFKEKNQALTKGRAVWAPQKNIILEL